MIMDLFFMLMLFVCAKQTSTDTYFCPLKLVRSLSRIWAKVFVERIMGNSAFLMGC